MTVCALVTNYVYDANRRRLIRNVNSQAKTAGGPQATLTISVYYNGEIDPTVDAWAYSNYYRLGGRPGVGGAVGCSTCPPGGRIFACRGCYDLAYPCQQNRWERRDPWAGLLRTKWGRLALAAADAQLAAEAAAPATLDPPRRPRGRPRTKRRYTHRAPPAPPAE